MKTKRMEDPYASKYNTDPTNIEEEYYIESKEGICGICFDKIMQPLIDGIWYHREHWDIDNLDHAPVPASIGLQLFYYFTRRNKAFEHFMKTKKCKHSRWWNPITDFPPLPEGYNRGHYYTTYYVSLCGQVMPLKERTYRKDRKNLHPKSHYFNCDRCIERLLKLGMIKRVFRKSKYYNSSDWHMKWLKTKLPKDFIKSEKAKYTKILK